MTDEVEESWLGAEAQCLAQQQQEQQEAVECPSWIDLRFRSDPYVWQPIDLAPRDGTLILVRDYAGNVDLSRWDGEWSCERGTCEEIAMFSRIAILGGGRS